MKKKILALLVTLVTVFLLVFSSPISAKGGGDSPKPGKGQGDTKHEHFGPPGHNDSNGKPGWGYGDSNHTHFGYGFGNRSKHNK